MSNNNNTPPVTDSVGRFFTHARQLSGLLFVLLICLVIWVFLPYRNIWQNAKPMTTNKASSEKSTPLSQVLSASLGLPIFFEENRGQMNSEVRFLARTSWGNLFLTSAGLIVTLNQAINQLQRQTNTAAVEPIELFFEGASPKPQVEVVGERQGTYNYLTGRNKERWITSAQVWPEIQYRNLYPGIDLKFYSRDQQPEFDFVIAPNASPENIRIRIVSASKHAPWISDDGNLIFDYPYGDFYLHKPVVWQEDSSGKKYIDGRFVLSERDVVRIEVGSYDQSRPLIIDPVLSFSTIYGGSGLEQGLAVASDSFGNSVITGLTTSPVFPGSGTGVSAGGQDIYVLRLSPSGTFLSATIIGGGKSDAGTGVAIDPIGRICLTGVTTSDDFPIKDAFQATPGGGESDGFVTMLNTAGDQIIWSTYLGGNAVDGGRAIASDSSGNVWTSGVTRSSNLPLLNPLQNQLRGRDESFVFKFSEAGRLLFSTYLGGSGDDRAGASIAVDAANNICLSGATDSSDFPTTPGGLQTDKRNAFDAFITKISSDGTKIIYSTFLGGSENDGSTAVAMNAAGDAFATGGTISIDFPTTTGALQRVYGGLDAASGGDAWVARLKADGTALVYSTYLGGRGDDGSRDIAIDLSDNAWVVGQTFITGSVSSQNFPQVDPLQMGYGGGFSDGFVAGINPLGTSLLVSTYLGGGDSDIAEAVSVDLLRNIRVTGFTLSSNFPLVNAIQQNRGSSLSDLFIASIKSNVTPSSLSNVSAASYSSDKILANETIVAAFGTDLADTATSPLSLPLPVSLAGTSVILTDSIGRSVPAPLFYVSPGQVNYYIPPGLRSGQAKVTLFTRNNKVAADTIEIASVSPGIFSADASGSGVAAALVLKAKPDGTQLYEPVSRYDPAQNKIVPIPIDISDEAIQAYLVLFGTGIRNHGGSVLARVGGVTTNVVYAGPQSDFIGLDQINVFMPRDLAGLGEVLVNLAVDGKAANPVSITIK